MGRRLRSRSRPRSRRRPRRCSQPAGSTCSAPSATSRAASTTSCADVPAVRATPARAGSTSRCTTTSCASSTPAPPRASCRAACPTTSPSSRRSSRRAIRSAQSQVEARNAEIRKNVLKYDDVLNRQREAIYSDRRHILEGDDLHERTQKFLEDVIDEVLDAHTAEGNPDEWDFDALWTELKTLYPIGITIDEVVAEAGEKGRVNRDVHPARDPLRREARLPAPRGAARQPGDARARAPRRALGDRPPLARPPLRDGLPEGRHRPARHGAARPAGRVPARGLRDVPAA